MAEETRQREWDEIILQRPACALVEERDVKDG
jgi:hypothetical protein